MSEMKRLDSYTDLNNLSRQALSELAGILMTSGSTNQEVSMLCVAALQIAGKPDTEETDAYEREFFARKKAAEQAELDKIIQAPTNVS